MRDFTLKQRDRYSFELKGRYVLGEKKQGQSSYDLDLYFFFPESFHINSDTYDTESFYEDLKLYIRFNTPELTVSELLDRESDESPLARLERMVEEHEGDGHDGSDTTIDRERFSYEARMLGSVYKSQLRDTLRAVVETERPPADAKVAELADTARVAERLHALTARVASCPKLDDAVREECVLLDEYVSLLLERYLCSFLRYVRSRFPETSCDRITGLVREEIRYRSEKGYPTVASPDAAESKLEEYVYREKMLKRYASEVLFFDVRHTDEGKRTEHVLYALAAGIAMVVATAIAFFGQSLFGNLTISFFVLLVVGYMLKDRIKDSFRDLFSRRLGKYFFDHKKRLYDRRLGKRLAVVKERARFVPPGTLPAEVRAVRNRGSFERHVAGVGTEHVLAYKKRLQLRSRALGKLHHRINGVAAIDIVSVQRMLRYLAVQYGTVPLLDGGETLQMEKVKRVYHMNVVMRAQTADREQLYRFRFVVDAKGIRRIEPVGQGAHVSPYRDRTTIIIGDELE